jgi:ferredoxin-type protein NapG
MNRRAFLWAGASVGVILGLGELGKCAHASRNLLRPPGGQDEARFESLCVKCDKCVEVCPTDVVAVANLEDGITVVRTPKLNFHLGYCNLCMKCIEVCPTGALLPIHREAVKIGVARIQREICIAWQWGGCMKCYGSCRPKAISKDALDRPVVDESKCTGCGECEFVCPASELRSYKRGQPRGIVVVPLELRSSGSI